MNYKARKVSSLILGLISALGTVATAILVAKETPAAMKKIKEIKEKNKDVKKIVYIKSLIPIYWPAGLICLGTMASTTISQVISMRTQASLIATSTMLSQGWNRYKGKVKDIFGIDADKAISTSMAVDDYKKISNENANSETLFYEEHLGFFRSDKTKLIAALSDLNQRLHTPDPNPNGTFYWTTLYFLMNDADAFVYDKKKLNASKELGWTTDYLCDVYDIQCMWVHTFFTKIVKKDTGELLFTKISFFEDPIFLNETERSRFHYKSRSDYEHEAECDMHDADAYALYSHACDDYEEKIVNIQSSMINAKQDCDLVNDDGRRFISSNNPHKIEYIEDDPDLPRENDIPIEECYK